MEMPNGASTAPQQRLAAERLGRLDAGVPFFLSPALPSAGSKVQRNAHLAEGQEQLLSDTAPMTLSRVVVEAGQGHPFTGHQPGVDSFKGRGLVRQHPHSIILESISSIRRRATVTALLRREAELPQMLVADARAGTGVSEGQPLETGVPARATSADVTQDCHRPGHQSSHELAL